MTQQDGTQSGDRKRKAIAGCASHSNRLKINAILNLGTDSMAHSASESATDIQYRIDRNEGAFSYGSTDCERTNAQRATDTIAGNDFREVYQDKSAHCRIESNRRSMHRSRALVRWCLSQNKSIMNSGIQMPCYLIRNLHCIALI